MLSLALLGQDRALEPDPPIACGMCPKWNEPREPFRVFGNTYYVGVAGLSSVLITSESGHVLIDGALPQSAPIIDRNIRSLGFRTEDIRLILHSHEHFDHVGGLAAFQRASGAPVAASPPAAAALERGEPTDADPQRALPDAERRFPRVAKVRRIADGETLHVGNLALTAHFTPGHTPGSTTWTWRSCEGERCLNVVYADSLNPVSASGYRFTAAPGAVERFRRSIDTVRKLPCDILLSVHPEFTGLEAKAARRAQGVQPDPFIDPAACRAYADRAATSLARRIDEERK